MTWFIGYNSVAGRQYRRRVFIAMSLYVVILLACSKLARVVPLHGWVLYLVAVLPAVPIIAVLVILGRYLQEETDEYLRMLTVRSLIIGAGALLSTIVINDFLRTIAHGAALGSFVGFIIFFVAFGIAQGVQALASREVADE